MKTLKLTFMMMLIFSSSWAEPLAPIPITPNEKVTPGDLCDQGDKDFTGFRYAEKMPYCERNVSKSVKRRVYEAYNIPEKCRTRYTIDHFVPLALGGNNAATNLWPEHKLVKETRQELEQELYNKVVQGLMDSKEASYILMSEKVDLVLDLSDVEGCG